MPEVRLNAKKGAKDGFPKEGLKRAADRWERIKLHGTYTSNLRAVEERRVFVKRLDGNGEYEFQGTTSGWHRLQDNKIVVEEPCDELLAFLHVRHLLRVTEIPDDALPDITRKITPEERKICRGMGRPTPIWRVQAERVKLTIMRRQDP